MIYAYTITICKLNGDVVAQSCSKGISCSETFQPQGSLSVTKTEGAGEETDEVSRGRNVSLQFNPLLCDCSNNVPIQLNA